MQNKFPTAEEIRNEVKKLVAEVTESSVEEVSDTALYVDELGIDSLMALEMMVALDKKYNIDIPEDEFAELKTVNETVDSVLRHLSKNESGPKQAVGDS